MIGMISFYYNANQGFDFTFNTSLICTGSMNFRRLTFNYFNFRIRTCPTGYPYFNEILNQCFDVCNPYTYMDNTIEACVACHYPCYSC